MSLLTRLRSLWSARCPDEDYPLTRLCAECKRVGIKTRMKEFGPLYFCDHSCMFDYSAVKGDSR